MDQVPQHGRGGYGAQLKSMLDATSQAVARSRGAHEIARQDLCNAPSVPNLKSAEELLEEFLSGARKELTAAQELVRSSGEASLLRRPIAVFKAKRALSEAKAKFNERYEHATQLEVTAQREAVAAGMRDQHALHISRKKAAKEAATKLAILSQFQVQLRTLIEPLADAIERNAWIAPGLGNLLAQVNSEMKKGLLNNALELLGSAQYQRLPTESTLGAWAQEREELIVRMEHLRPGFSAIAPFQGLVSTTLEIIQKGCPGPPWEASMAEFEHWSDRWHAIPRCLLSPAHLADPVQWILYWAILSQTQVFTEDLHDSIANEDVLTGVVTGMLRQELRGWAKNRLKDLGYPRAKAELELVQIAGTRGERQTGADLGVIVQVDVGDLRVHKVALLQAKISERGKANIGSKPSGARKLTQLQKLTNASKDHFLFYHIAKSGSPAMLPTVSPVRHFIETYNLDEAGMAREHIPVDTRTQGSDLASFVAFGLCRPLGEGLGQDVLTEQDALDVLSSGGATELPSYVVVVSMTDYDRSPQHVLSKLANRGYSSPSRGKGVTRRCSPEPSRDEPELDM